MLFLQNIELQLPEIQPEEYRSATENDQFARDIIQMIYVCEVAVSPALVNRKEPSI